MKKRGLKDQKAQRANLRAADNKTQFIRSLQSLQRKRICQLDEEMMEIKRDLMNIKSHQPNYFLEPTRPSSARLSSRQYRHRGQHVTKNVTVTIPSVRPTTAPETRETGRQNSRDVLKKVSIQSQNSQCSERSTQSNRTGNGTNTATTTLEPTEEAPASLASRWKSGNTRVKLDAVKMLQRSHQEAKKRMESTQDVSTSAELDKIKSISKWLSIKKISEQPRGIPPIAMRYIQSRHKDWKFDFNSFIQKEFPPDPKVRVEAAVPEEVMEEQKKCFNNLTAARALLKFKRRLNDFRAKTEEERAAEKMWEDLKKVRYLRIPGCPTEPRCYSTTPDLSRPESVFDEYLR
ncbi:hypothetical protein ACHWQZ_G012883 [Mnemiopsis leidyi]